MRLAPLLAQCDLFVSHGGDVCAGTLMSGVPQLVFPVAVRAVPHGAPPGADRRGPLAPDGSRAFAGRGGARSRPARAGVRGGGASVCAALPELLRAEQQRRIVVRIEEILRTAPHAERLYSAPLRKAREGPDESRGAREEPDPAAEAGMAGDRRRAAHRAGPLHGLRDDPRGDSRGVRIHRLLDRRRRGMGRDLPHADRCRRRAHGGELPAVARLRSTCSRSSSMRSRPTSAARRISSRP